jgi:predicted metal-dependent enzyme (double-stranded beta helix superfamily)
MSQSLDGLAGQIRELLAADGATLSADKMCALVSQALADDDFVVANLPDRGDGVGPREILYEDTELGFCICGHVYAGEAIGPPHDHGSSWALYGQARGTTEMTEWKIVEESSGDAPKLVEPVRTYKLSPGDVHFYDVGDVHSPKRTAPTRLIRIEGANLDNVMRSNIAKKTA